MSSMKSEMTHASEMRLNRKWTKANPTKCPQRTKQKTRTLSSPWLLSFSTNFFSCIEKDWFATYVWQNRTRFEKICQLNRIASAFQRQVSVMLDNIELQGWAWPAVQVILANLQLCMLPEKHHICKKKRKEKRKKAYSSYPQQHPGAMHAAQKHRICKKRKKILASKFGLLFLSFPVYCLGREVIEGLPM